MSGNQFQRFGWLVAATTGVLVAYVLYQLTLQPDPDACNQYLPAAAIADEGQDQENLVDHALLRQPGCEAGATP